MVELSPVDQTFVPNTQVIVLREEYLISIPYVLPFLAMVTLPLLGFSAHFFQNGEHHEK
jgi:hypothetical protein